MNKYRKTKAERQQWWNGLTPDEQQDYIQRQQHKKSERRRNSTENCHLESLSREDQAHLDSIREKK